MFKQSIFIIGLICTSFLSMISGTNTRVSNTILGFEADVISLEYYHFKFSSKLENDKEDKFNYNNDFKTLTHAWWNFVCGEKDQYSKVKAIFDRYIEDGDINDNRQAFILLLSGTYKLRMEATLGKKISVIRSYMKLAPCLKIILEKENECEEFYLISSLYHYGWGTHGNMFSNFLSFGLPNADPKKGREMLEKSIESSNALVKSEALYFLYKLDEAGKGNEGIVYLNSLIEMYPDNIVYRLERMNLEKTGDIFSQKTRKLIVNHTGLSSLQKNHLFEVWRSRYKG